jgi:hypothetical protein
MSFQLADTFAGAYRLDGIDAKRKNYVGSAVIAPQGLFGHVAAAIENALPRHGLAVVQDKRLLIAWGPKDKVEIGAYWLGADSMHGIWIPPTAGGLDMSICGQEKSVRVGLNEWRIEQADDLEKNPYTGTITIRPISGDQPQIVEILWKLHDGEYRSFGLRGDDWMVSTFNFEPEKPHAIAAYERIQDGWKGVLVWNDDREVSRETLTSDAMEKASGRLTQRGAA